MLSRVILLIVAVLGMWMSYLHVGHRLAYGHFAPVALHADIVIHNASIGIPGITKTYEAILRNYGFFPALVEGCSYLSDTGFAGSMVAYNIEHWNPTTQAWKRVVEFAKPEFCTPMPLSTGNTRWGRSWLWPGQTVSTEEEATGGRGLFKKGDTLRLMVVIDVTGAAMRRASHPTQPFTLDEQPLDSETRFRVRH
jgi:hypothetical protein